MRLPLRNGITIVLFLLLLPLLGQSVSKASISLKDPQFNASGDGDTTTTGAIEAGDTELNVADATTWNQGQGIRISRAGAHQPVHEAESGWRAVSPQVKVVYDAADKKQGNASVRCTSLDPAEGPVDLCEAGLSQPINFTADELRFWIKSSIAAQPGNLQMVLLTRSGEVEKGELELPALRANEWTEVFVPIQGEAQRRGEAGLNQVQQIRLRCHTQCERLAVQLDDFELVQDLVTQVVQIKALPEGGTVFSLDQVAKRTVENEVVYHDDTVAAGLWLKQANQPKGADLSVPPGVYYISQSLPLYSHTNLRCDGAETAIFKNTGRSRTGATGILSTKTAGSTAPTNITIENCGFDSNGWNLKDFLSVISIFGSEPAREISIRNNHFFDSVFDRRSPIAMNCDRGQDACEILQRQYILVLNVDGAWIEHNRLSGGGRIKVGRPGRNFYIRHNQIDLVNDNAITVVDDNGNDGCARARTPCITEQVEITDNTINNPVGVGIFFGADGDPSDDPNMSLRNITVARNHISGFFTGAIKGVLPATTEDVNVTANTIEATRSREKLKELHTQGILIKRGDAANKAATKIKVEGNTVLASGAQAIFSVSGITFQGDMTDLTVTNNQIRCEGCLSIRRGIWFSGGIFQTVAVSNNLIDRTIDAIDVTANLVDATVGHNQFLNSTGNRAGQISIALDPEETIKAQIAQNQIQGGANFGIFCRGNGRFDLAIDNNHFVGHEGREISRTCFSAVNLIAD